MRSIIAIFAVLSLIISAVAMADLSSSDEDVQYFTVGDFTYFILNPSEVELISFDEDSTEENVIIESSVVNPNDMHAYNITKVSASFSRDDISTITIGENVTDVTYADFSGNGLQAFYVAGGDHFGAVDGVLFKKSGMDNHILIKYPKGKTNTSYSTPATIAEIGENAFFGCGNLNTVTLNEGLIKIDYSAFECCYELSNVRTTAADHSLPTTLSIIGYSAFAYCGKLATLTLPDDLAFIGSSAFEHTGLTELNIPYGIEYIGSGAFRDCESLVKFTSDNYMYKAEETSGVLYKDENNLKTLFAYPAGAPAATYQIPEDFGSIATFAFSGCANLNEVIFNETCVSIPDMAFYRCSSLTTINLDGIITVGISSFSYCENLSSVNFGSTLTYIDVFAFEDTGLEYVTIPSSVTYIDTGAFSNCDKLKEFTIPEDSKVTLDSLIFADDWVLKDIYIESSDVKLLEDSLVITYNESEKTSVNVHVVKGYSIPDNASNEFTELNIIIIGERPYPWENWIGVFFCVLVIIGILWAVREV